MSDLEPITRREVFLNAIAEGGGEVPEPVTREEVYLKAILDNGGGGGGGDVIEGYLYEEHFYADAQHTEEITGEVGKIYVDLTTNRCYRWRGSVFVEIGDNRTFTANRALVSDASGLPSASNVTDTEIGYLSGVTGAIQTQINGKQNTLTFDNTPTAQSTNPVTSGGIKSYVDGQGAKTASGNHVTLTDAEAMNADHVVATITPTQTGSGTPSPSNVRPFVGFSSVDLNVSKKNIVNTSPSKWEVGTYDNNGSEFSGGVSDRVRTKWNNYIIVVPNTTYTFSIDGSNYNYFFFAYDENDNMISEDSRNSSWISGSTTITINKATRIRICIRKANNTNLQPSEAVTSKIQAEVGEQVTAYEPYQGQTYTVQLGDTYYQGDIDVTNGVLRCEWVTDNVAWFNRSNASQYWVRPTPTARASTNAFCTKLPSRGVGETYGVSVDASNALIFKFNEEYESVQAALDAYGGSLDVLYQLETPIEIQLTPQQIALLENNNTITTNVSSIDVTYQTNNGIGDTSSALDKRVTRLESKVPQPPTTDGTYKLTVTVASGEPTYSWESAT